MATIVSFKYLMSFHKKGGFGCRRKRWQDPWVELRGRSFQGQVRENFLFTERLVAVRGAIKRIGMWIGSLA